MIKYNGWNNHLTPMFGVGGKQFPISDGINSLVKESFKPKKTFLEWVKEDNIQKVRNRIKASFNDTKLAIEGYKYWEKERIKKENNGTIQ